MNSVESEISYTGLAGGNCCCCRSIPRTLWSLLCNQLFDLITNPMMDSEGTFEEVQIWSEGEITMTVTSSPYTFVMEVADGVPKANDIIYFGRKFYIIGAASLTGTDTYTCTGCLSIDVSIVGVYAALLVLQDTVTAAETTRATNEAVRVLAESARVSAESARATAEASRAQTFTESQASRTSTFNASLQAMQDQFDAAEAARTTALESITTSFLTPVVVTGTLGAGNRLFTPSSGSTTTVATAYQRFYQGHKTFLSVQGYGTEEIIADDGECLVTRSSWKWQY